ncbi:MAG: alanine racemase, partial [Bacteroidetes bacterium]|nr:alanine racemase [Bacteroidota bacterium]
LAVAYADEGIELREGGITLPIMVLNPEEAVFDSLLRYQLEPEIYSPRLLRQFGQFTRHAPGEVPIHLKVDTGMRRLGFMEGQMDELLHLLRSYPQLRVRTVFSHLAASDMPGEDDFTSQQVAQFQGFCERLEQELPHPFIRHILNSSGITRFPQYQMDMVRLGIGAYGIDPSPAMQEQLQTVFTLRARISQIKTLAEGETIGYSRAGRLPGPGRTATVSIGYADGLPRIVSNGRYALQIRGQRAPIVGTVCMDMCMVDVTHIPEAAEGDEVLVFGPGLEVRELAEAMETIPYEVFTSVSPRVRRVYTDG